MITVVFCGKEIRGELTVDMMKTNLCDQLYWRKMSVRFFYFFGIFRITIQICVELV